MQLLLMQAPYNGGLMRNGHRLLFTMTWALQQLRQVVTAACTCGLLSLTVAKCGTRLCQHVLIAAFHRAFHLALHSTSLPNSATWGSGKGHCCTLTPWYVTDSTTCVTDNQRTMNAASMAFRPSHSFLPNMTCVASTVWCCAFQPARNPMDLELELLTCLCAVDGVM